MCCPIEVDLDTYLTINVHDTFAETLGINNNHVDVIVVNVWCCWCWCY